MKSVSSFLDKKRHVLVFAMALVLGVLAYRGSFSAPFYFDDYARIVDNPFIKHFNIPLLWGHDTSRFITNLSFNLNYVTAGYDLAVWHFTSLAIHVVNAYLVYRLTALTFQAPVFRGRYPKNAQAFIAVTASLIFLLHPVQTQAVIYLYQRATLLYSLCYLGAVYFYVRARIEGKDRFYAAAVLISLIGLFTKGSFLTLPLGIILYNICFLGFDKKRDVKHSFVFFLLALPLLVIPALSWSQGTISKFAADGFRENDFTAHFWTYFNVIMTYIRLMVLPINLNLDYDYPWSRSLFDFPTFLSVAAVIGLWFTGFKRARKSPWVTFCIFWFFIALGTQTWIYPSSETACEHWIYLSCYSFALGGALLFYHVSRRPQIYLPAAGLLLTAFFILTWQRSSLWADPIAFLSDSAAKSPNKPRVLNNLGTAYLTRQRFAEARKLFEKAVAIDPAYTVAAVNLADIHIQEKDYEKAESSLKKILMFDPEHGGAFFHLGRLYALQGDYNKALYNLNQAQLRTPYYPHVHMGLSNIYEKTGDLLAAKREISLALWLSPDNSIIYYNMGNINFQLKNFYEAMINYSEAIRRKPAFPEALNNLGHIYFYFQDYKKAIDQYKKAIRVAPNLPEGYFHLGNTLYQTGKIEESRSAITTAIRLYRQQGKTDMADTLESKLHAPAH